jgi:ParB-like chromosome segregation protein Spo0J
VATEEKEKVELFEIHPAAAIFPMLTDTELNELAASVEAHGLREKIAIIPNPAAKGKWLVLDGRNRLGALRLLKINDKKILEEHVRIVDLKPMNATPEEYVLMANIERRNLTQEQRRSLAGKLAIMLSEAQKDLPKEERIDALSEAAKKAGVSRRTAATAKKAAGGTKKVKKSAAKKVGVLPGVANAQLGKIAQTLERLGHNWPMGLLEETKANTEKIVTKLDELIAKKKAEETT